MIYCDYQDTRKRDDQDTIKETMVLLISFKCFNHFRGVIGRWIFDIGIEFVKSGYMRAGNFLFLNIAPGFDFSN